MKTHEVISLFYIITILFSCNEEALQVDILIANGKIYDGISNNPIETNIALKDDKIIYIGTNTSAIEATDRLPPTRCS